MMLKATLTRVIRFVIADEAFTIEHGYRSLASNAHRISELPSPVNVHYPAHVPFSLIAAYASKDVRLYIDEKGWVFDEHVITLLLTNKTIRNAIDSDLNE